MEEKKGKKQGKEKKQEKKETFPEQNNEEIKKGLEECQKQKKEYLTGWQRARADFINYKKEEEQRIKKLLEWEKENLILEILPILDNFELAEKNLDDKLKKEQNIAGLRQIKNQLQEFLRKQGVEEIDVLDKGFDPSTSEAIEEIKKEGAKSGFVLSIIQKGYRLNERVIRPARVKISK